MSGGSYGYLESELRDGEAAEQIENMAIDAESEGYGDFAAELRALHPSEPLLDSIHAYEWWKSMDYSQAQFEKTLSPQEPKDGE